MSKKVLLIGIDAGSFNTIDPLIESGEMPNLKAYLNNGYRTRLESSTPPWTPTAWTSLTTGKNPGKHGIFDFKTTDQSRLVSAGDVKTNRIWNYLDVAGHKSIVVNVPVTHPAPSFNGILIPGYLGPESDEFAAHPPEIIDELREEIGDYRVYIDGDPDDNDERFEEYLNLMEMRKAAIVHLTNTYDWEFAMVQFQRTDTVFHELPEEEYIKGVYKHLDKLLGDIKENIDADTVLLASDHGMGSTGKWDFRINSWLQSRGYLKTSSEGYTPGWNKPKESDKKTNSSVLSGLNSIGLTAQRIESLVDKLGIKQFIIGATPRPILKRVVDATAEKIDKSESVAYCPSGAGLGIYCSDDAATGDIVSELRGLKDPDGQQVFEFVKLSENVYDGSLATTGPDILVMPRNLDYYVSGTLSASIFDEGWHKYNHKRNGMLVASGESISGGDATDSWHIEDLAPTILSILNVDLDREFDGEPIADLLNSVEIPKSRKYDFDQALTDQTEHQNVESRLEDLGYL